MKIRGDRSGARTLMEDSLARRERLADESARIESGRTRRDLAKAHLYLQELLMEEAPATARRHLKQHLDLTFEVAWLDPMDRRGAVVDLMKAMSIAARLVKLDGGDTSAFASESPDSGIRSSNRGFRLFPTRTPDDSRSGRIDT